MESKQIKEKKTSSTGRLIFRIAAVSIVLISLVSVYFAGKVKFDANLDNFSYVPKHLQEAENYLDTISDFKLKNVYLISKGKNFDEAVEHGQQYLGKLDSLKQQGVIDGYTSINQLWPGISVRQERLNKWKKFWTPERISQLEKNVQTESSRYKFKPGVFDGFISWIKNPPVSTNDLAFKQMQELVFEDLIQQTKGEVRLVTLIRIKEENKPALYSAFTPKDFVFDNKFIFNKLLDILRQDFNLLSALSTILVFVVVLLTFRRIEIALSTMIPMMLGWTMTLGFMAVLDIRLNIFNLIICTFIFGLGMDYSIFYGRGLLDKYRNQNNDEASFRTSIILSLITTLLGMGVLIFAKHPALRSIGIVSVIGLFSVTIITFLIQPVIFNFILYYRKKPRKLPLTPSSLVTTLVYFGFYVFNLIFMSIMGILLVKTRIVPGGLKIYERMNAIMAYLTLGFAFVLKRNFKEVDKNVFKHPAIIVANHQSSLDIVLVALLSPRIRIVTKQWVFKMPLMGFIARTLQFYPAEEINEPEFVEKAKRDLANGYFILFFAEGTRSFDQSIHRFKKGAFLLAEQTGSDILPMLIHGTGVSMPSGTALIGPGIMQVKMLPLIKHNSPDFPKEYSAKAKAVNNWMRSEFYTWRKEIESWRFIRLGLRPVFIYRAPQVRVAYKNMLLEKEKLTALDSLIGEKESVSIAGANYGELAHYLYFRSATRSISVCATGEEQVNELNFLKNWNEDLKIVSSENELHSNTLIIQESENISSEILLKFNRIIVYNKYSGTIPTDFIISEKNGLFIYERN